MLELAATALPTSSLTIYMWPILLLLVVGTVTAVLLRWAGIRQPGIIAGLIAGTLCGTLILGNVYPQLHQHLFVGAASEHAALVELRKLHHADLLALTHAGVSDSALTEEQQKQQRLDAEAVILETQARWAHGRGLRFFGFLLSGILLGWLLPSRRSAVLEPQTPTTNNNKKNTKWSDAAFAALWTMVIVIGFVGGAILLVFKGGRLEALGVGVAFSSLALGLTNHSKISSSMQRVALVGWLASIIMLIVALWGFVGAENAVVAGISPSTVIAAGLGFLFGCLLRSVLGDGNAKRMMALFGGYVVLPFVTAVLCLRIDYTDTSTAMLLWPAALGMLIGGDARWFGIASGLRLTGWNWSRSMRASLPLADASAMQILVAFTLVMAGWIASPGAILMVVGGAILSDLTTHVRGNLLTRMQTEIADLKRDLEKQSDDEDNEPY